MRLTQECWPVAQAEAGALWGPVLLPGNCCQPAQLCSSAKPVSVFKGGAGGQGRGECFYLFHVAMR